MAKRKLTPEERAAKDQFRRESEEHLQKLRELVDKGWTELERKGIASRHPERKPGS